MTRLDSKPTGGLLLAALLLLSACAGRAPAPEIRGDESRILIHGDLERPSSQSADELLRRFADAVETVHHRTRAGSIELRGIPLQLIVDAAGLAPRTDRKHPEQAFAVMVAARDGYAVGFSYEELVRNREGRHEVFLAVAEADGPLPERFGPARLVLEREGGNSRRLAAVNEIRVLDLTGHGDEASTHAATGDGR